MRSSLFSLAVLSVGFFSLPAEARPLSESALFARCYAQLTGKPVPLNHAVHKQVKDGQIKALDACNALLDKGALSAGGALVRQSDPEAEAVLTQLYNFHRTWFPVSNQEQLPDYSGEYALQTEDVFDMTEPALALTKAALGGHQYREVITSFRGVRAMRRANMGLRQAYGYNAMSPSRRVYASADLGFYDQNHFWFRGSGGFSGNGSSSVSVQLPMIQVGDLVGIGFNTAQGSAPSYTLTPLAITQDEPRVGKEPGLMGNLDLMNSHGGGIMGYPIYLLTYLGHGKGVKMDGALKMPRKWSQQTMQTFMCTSFPALRESDVAQFVVPGSPTPFRGARACVTCHGTLDQMGSVARNFTWASSDFTRPTEQGADNRKVMALIGKFNADLPPHGSWSDRTVENFHRQTPTGRLYFRAFSGELIDIPVNGLTQLGEAMASTDDFYQCAAKRYFEFMTGIQVPLFDRRDPKNSDLLRNISPAAINDRKYVETMGLELKQHQSVVRLLKNIMASPYYRESTYRPE